MYHSPAADIIVDVNLIRRLLREQHPDLAGLRLQLLDTGWDNYIFRLGEDLLLRFPRRQVAVRLLENEQRWLSGLQERLNIPIPAPLCTGQPSEAFPWPWSVLPYLAGDVAAEQAPDGEQAFRLGAFLKALHRPAPAEAPHNEYRSVPLQDRATGVEERLRWLTGKTDLINDRLLEIWQLALHAPLCLQKVWIHGDLHARNVIVDRGKISGIIDWGDIGAGDPATDLLAVWALFEDAGDREKVWLAYGDAADTPLRQRAAGWAILHGSALLSTGLTDHPQHAQMGLDTLSRVLQDGAI